MVTLLPTQSDPARGTWALQRRHRLPLSDPLTTTIRRALAGGEVAGSNIFRYRGRSTLVRPTATRLLAALWQADGRAIDIEAACQFVYGRPATMRAMRQTAFRASRALDRVGCPLVVGCRNAHLFLLRRARPFAAERD